MGISIHYTGSFDKEKSLTDFIEEVEEIVKVYNWKYNVFKRQFGFIESEDDGEDLYGIVFTPPKCEPVWLCFLQNGKTSNPINIKHHNYEETSSRRELKYYSHTKTQYAGFEVHNILIGLLRYLSEKYFLSFNCIDETRLWETGNEEAAKQKFKEMDYLLDSLASALEDIPRDPETPLLLHIQEVIKMVMERKGKK